ncbi:MAG: PhzF family phenazine biosynthesis protein [Verrucomicrobiota bacterium]
MKLSLFQVDAFAGQLFEGNPAAVVPLEAWLPDEMLQKIAMENQLSETSFVIARGDGEFDLRWFTPVCEVNLCGHATLATAHVLMTEILEANRKTVFHTRSGALQVSGKDEGYQMKFPRDLVTPCDGLKGQVESVLGLAVGSLYAGKEDLMAVLHSESDVRSLAPDFKRLSAIPHRGLIVTAQGDESDFVSRCFFPRFGIDEDPVTGSAHTTMAPYWGERLARSSMDAIQLSARKGRVGCELVEDQVWLTGGAVTFLRGEIEV